MTKPNISELTSQSIEIFDGLPAKDRETLKRRDKLDRADISAGVISDYVEIIEYLADRQDLREEKIIPTPVLSRAKTTPQIVLFYKGHYAIDDSTSKIHRSETCRRECEFILLNDYAETVLRMEIDIERLKPVSGTMRRFKKAANCEAQSGLMRDDTGRHPCFVKTTPDDEAKLLEEDGLYVYNGQVSPLWPDVFFIDGSKPRKDYGILAIAYSRPVEAFNHLEHVRAFSTPDSVHRAVIEKRNGFPDKSSMLIDQISLSISPPLPEEVIEHLIKETVGEAYFSDVEQDGEKIWTGDPGEIFLGHDFNRKALLFKK